MFPAGVYTFTLAGAAFTVNPGDRVTVTVEMANDSTMNQTIGITPSELINSPIDVPATERHATRLMRKSVAGARHESPRSARVQVFAPEPPPRAVPARATHVVHAQARHGTIRSTRGTARLQPVFERIQERLLRVAFAGRRRHPGSGQVLKQTFPPPVFERIQSRLMRVALAARRRWQAPSRRQHVLAPFVAPPSVNIFASMMRVARGIGRDPRLSQRLQSLVRQVVGPAPPVVAANLKRIAGWFRNFLRIG
ncbi:MAG: hypothetical protein L0099_08500 [Acidobacteria bacterium]|nr:hypothetical protein [Acidobacteriota bacterium]